MKDQIAPKQSKPLKGVGIVIRKEGAHGEVTTLGICFAPSIKKLKDLIKTMHGANITVNLPDIRGGEIILK